MESADVSRIAALANLDLPAAERRRIEGEFSAILGFIGELRQAQADEVAPTNQVTELENVYRADTVTAFPHVRTILESAPHRHGEHLKVAGVFAQTDVNEG